MLQLAYKLQSPSDTSDEDDGQAARFGRQSPDEDLPYKVEVWDEAGAFVENVVAVSVNPAIGFAAYYAAAREFPGRAVTLRYKDRVLSRWPGRSH